MVDGGVVGQKVPDGDGVLFLVAVKQTGATDGHHEVTDEPTVGDSGVACEVEVLQEEDDGVG